MAEKVTPTTYWEEGRRACLQWGTKVKQRRGNCSGIVNEGIRGGCLGANDTEDVQHPDFRRQGEMPHKQQGLPVELRAEDWLHLLTGAGDGKHVSNSQFKNNLVGEINK